MHSFHHVLYRNSKLFIKLRRGGGGAKALHADENAVLPYVALPAERGGGFADETGLFDRGAVDGHLVGAGAQEEDILFTYPMTGHYRLSVEAVDKPRLSLEEMKQIAHDYARDWDLGDEAHPCDLKSSTDISGRVRSGYVPPPVLIA